MIMEMNLMKRLGKTMRELAERKWAEEALRESEETFSTLFHSNPVGIVITTLKGRSDGGR